MALAQKDTTLDTPLGQVIRIPCKFIKGKSDAQAIVIKAIAAELEATGRNVLPVIVQMTGEDRYQAVLNAQILDGARQAKRDFVWCIVVDKQMHNQALVETGGVVKVDIVTASEQEIIALFDYLKTQSKGFSGVDPKKAAKAIVEYRGAKKITSLNFLSKLKCGIGAAKVKLLADNLVISKV